MKVQIRFNTDSLKYPEKNLPEWRVIVDGAQYYARNVEIAVKSWTTMDEIAPGILKCHITCDGIPTWDSEAELCRILP